MNNTFFLLILLIVGCRSTKEIPAGNKQTNNYPAAATPHSCLIQGIIIGIAPLADVPDSSSLCGRIPCNATVLITKAESCGGSIVRPVHIQDTLEVHFVFSLSPTRLVQPDIKPALPGLTTGDRFEAWMEQRLMLGDRMACRITSYKKL